MVDWAYGKTISVYVLTVYLSIFEKVEDDGGCDTDLCKWQEIHKKLLQWGIIDAEIKPPSPPPSGIPGLSKVIFSKPGVGQNIALHAVPADRISTYLVSAFPIHLSSSFSPPPKLSDHKQ